ncbi:MAG: protein kinase domain-containing protein [Planctomycetaceae bacterium]
MNTASDMPEEERHPVELLAEEFAERMRAGELPDVEAYCRRLPEHSQLLRAVLSTVLATERVSGHHQAVARAESAAATVVMPQTAGDFQLLREIGRGGMGIVYEALQKSLKRRVALKVVNQFIAGSEKQLRRFRREAESAARLHHSNIVPVYGFGEDQGLQFYAMQLIEGSTLAEVLDVLRELDPVSFETAPSPDVRAIRAQAAARRLLSAKTLPSLSPSAGQGDLTAELAASSPMSSDPDPTVLATAPANTGGDFQLTQSLPAAAEVTNAARSAECVAKGPGIILPPEYFRHIARLTAAAANGLHYAHGQGILHRDIKPANLLLDPDGTIRIADFGLARAIEPAAQTQTGEIVGTLRYMAPEQLRGQADQRTDVYALGLTLQELLTLQPPGIPLMSAGGQRETVSLRTLRPEVPRDLETIVQKACSAEPERRYQTAADLEADLLRFLEDRPILARPAGLAERVWRWSRRNPQLATLSAATLLLMLSVVVILGVSNRRIQRLLTARDKQYERAEQSLQDKGAALQTADRERQRAEKNLQLAVTAFEEVFANISARGRAEVLLEELGGEESLEDTTAVLSAADVTLLETLLGFFDRLAAENSRNLGLTAAEARRRVGDIQRQLGRLEDAAKSYQQALEACRNAETGNLTDTAAANIGQTAPAIVEARILHELQQLEMRRGNLPAALQALQQLRAVLSPDSAAGQSTAGRHLLAASLNGLTAMGLRQGLEPRSRFRAATGGLAGFPAVGAAGNLRGPVAAGGFAGPGAAGAGVMEAALEQRLRRAADTNAEALRILRQLTSEDSSNLAWQLDLARALRDSARITQLRQDWPAAEPAVQEAVKILELLHSQHPETALLQFELADVLGTLSGLRPGDLPQLQRSVALSRQLSERYPGVPEYRSLLAATLARVAGVSAGQGQFTRAESDLQEAVEILQSLAEQYSEAVTWHVALGRTRQQLAGMYLRNNRPQQARAVLQDAITELERVVNGARLNGRQRPALLAMLKRLREMQPSE